MSELINIKELNERIERESVFVDTLRQELGKVIVGQSHLVDTLLIGLLSNGHILLEGVPGLAKTLAITTLAKAVDVLSLRLRHHFVVIAHELPRVLNSAKSVVSFCDFQKQGHQFGVDGY